MLGETFAGGPGSSLQPGDAIEARPPPPEPSLAATLRENLLGSWGSSLVTIAGLVALAVALPPLLRFLIFDAVWVAPDGVACRAPGAGACWAFIAAKLPYLVYGAYPRGELWRVDAALACGGVLIFWILWLDAPWRRAAAILFFVVFPPVAFVLLYGAPVLGLARVTTDSWGGIFVSLLVALVGIVVSLPLGVLLALGRRSQLPVISLACTSFIEVVRGVPLITVLFMANTMLPLFVPEDLAPDRLVRPLIGVTLFASAYMAEVVRGGLQAIPVGQTEAAQALGLHAWTVLRRVVLPQALRHVVPGIVNTFIGLFKDTTLVAVVGIFDFLRTIESARLDPVWAGPTISATGYAFAAMIYFVFCFGMSRYSMLVERRLDGRH